MLNTPKYIIVHHTGGTNANPLADTSHHTFEMVDAYHKSLGWECIGYHYFIEKDGALKAGRAENYHGAHTIGHNDDSLGICLAGNFDQTLPTKEQVLSLTGLLKGIRQRYTIPLENIVPHRKFATKTCYGSKLKDDWAMKLLEDKIDRAQVLSLLDELRKKIEVL